MRAHLTTWALSMALTTRTAEQAVTSLREAAAVLLAGEDFTCERAEFAAAMAKIVELLNINED